MANQDITTFQLSLAIVNSDANVPVVFLHLRVNPDSKNISGECELVKPSVKPSSSKTKLSGDYKLLNIMHEGDRNLVNLLGYTAYDQACPTIKITLITDCEWKNGKAFYEYLENGEWLKVNDLNLKIK